MIVLFCLKATAFIQEPEDAYVSRYSQPVTLTCSADVSSRELLSFECNGQAVESTQIEYTEEAGNHVASIGKDYISITIDIPIGFCSERLILRTVYNLRGFVLTSTLALTITLILLPFGTKTSLYQTSSD